MAEWIITTIVEFGYLGIVFLMFVENIFPPIPSELILPFAGFAAARGDLDPLLVLLAATTGAVLGAIPWYTLGRVFGSERIKRLSDRHGRWLTVNREDLNRAERWFTRHGGKTVFFARLVPILRTVVSVPAGLARMPLFPFFLLTAFGSLLWSGLLIGAGFLLEEEYEHVSAYIDPATTLILGAIVGVYLFRLVFYKRKGFFGH